MSKYNNFETFVEAFVDESNRKCRERSGHSLADAFNSPFKIVEMVLKVLGLGWGSYTALVGSLVLGPIAFALALVGFIASPIMAIALVLGGVAAIRLLYKFKYLPIAIKEVGAQYRDDFNSHMGDTVYIDRLIDRASEELIVRAVNDNIRRVASRYVSE